MTSPEYSLEEDVKRLRELNEKLQQEYVDLICQFADFSTQATETTIRVERAKRVLEQNINETEVEQLQKVIRIALAHLMEE